MKFIAVITHDIDYSLQQIIKNYEIENNKITILKNLNEESFVLTFNVEAEFVKLLKNSFIIHKHGGTNTIFTINALNKLVDSENQIDVNWNNYQNTLITTDKGVLKINDTEYFDTYISQ